MRFASGSWCHALPPPTCNSFLCLKSNQVINCMIISPLVFQVWKWTHTQNLDPDRDYHQLLINSYISHTQPELISSKSGAFISFHADNGSTFRPAKHAATRKCEMCWWGKRRANAEKCNDVISPSALLFFPVSLIPFDGTSDTTMRSSLGFRPQRTRKAVPRSNNSSFAEETGQDSFTVPPYTVVYERKQTWAKVNVTWHTSKKQTDWKPSCLC